MTTDNCICMVHIAGSGSSLDEHHQIKTYGMDIQWNFMLQSKMKLWHFHKNRGNGYYYILWNKWVSDWNVSAFLLNKELWCECLCVFAFVGQKTERIMTEKKITRWNREADGRQEKSWAAMAKAPGKQGLPLAEGSGWWDKGTGWCICLKTP